MTECEQTHRAHWTITTGPRRPLRTPRCHIGITAGAGMFFVLPSVQRTARESHIAYARHKELTKQKT